MPPSSHALVFFIGYRGAGKTTVAKTLAERLRWDYADSDDLIEAAAGKSIAELFSDHGEPAFRDREEHAVAELCGAQRTVVALGGGAVLREATRQRLAEAGPVVWLTASAGYLAERLKADRTTPARRPSLTGRTALEEIEQVLAERAPIYRACATLTIDTERKTPAAIAEEIASALGLP